MQARCGSFAACDGDRPGCMLAFPPTLCAWLGGAACPWRGLPCGAAQPGSGTEPHAQLTAGGHRAPACNCCLSLGCLNMHPHRLLLILCLLQNFSGRPPHVIMPCQGHAGCRLPAIASSGTAQAQQDPCNRPVARGHHCQSRLNSFDFCLIDPFTREFHSRVCTLEAHVPV